MKTFLFKLFVFFSIPLFLWICVLAILKTDLNYNYAKFLYLKKEQNLKANSKNKKIVIIGGSNAKFNYQSNLIDSATNNNFKIINSAVMGNIGLINHFELIKPYLQQGDYVVLSPEYDMLQTNLGLHGNYQSLQIAPVKNDFYLNIFKDRFRLKNFLTQSLNHFKVIAESLWMKKTLPQKTINDVINNFHNANGEICLYPDNVKFKGYDIHLSGKLNEMSIKSINDFYTECKKKGINFIIILPATCNNYTHFNVNASTYLRNLKNQLKCPIYGNPNDFLFDQSLFLDSPYHLNKKGKELYTKSILKYFP